MRLKNRLKGAKDRLLKIIISNGVQSGAKKEIKIV
jgi:hypothetical protein